jgi:hypothetical protein
MERSILLHYEPKVPVHLPEVNSGILSNCTVCSVTVRVGNDPQG